MMRFFVEGGYGMWPVLVFGLLLLGATARYAWDLHAVRLRFVVAMFVLEIAASLHSSLTAVAQVLWYVEDRTRTPDAEFARTLVEGLKESTRPAILGGALVVLALVLLAVGVYRAGRRELRSGAA